MSKLRTTIILVLLFASISSQTEPAAGTACKNNNPFIELVKLSKYKAPELTSHICAFEFATYGTCCDQWNFGPYAANEARYLAQDVDRIVNEYETFKGIIPKVYGLLKKIAFAPLHSSRTDWNQKIGIARSLFQNSTLLQYFEENLKVAHKAGDFKEASQECWNFQSKVRDLTLCFTCSGRSNHFFNNRKALISQATCNTFVSKCASPLSNLVRFVKALEVLPWLGNQLKKLDVYLNVDAKLNTQEVNKYFEIFRNENIEQLIDAAESSSSPHLHATMCSKFFRLRETPIVAQMRPMFSSNSKWEIKVEEISKYLDQAKVAISANLKVFEDHLNSMGHSSTTNFWSVGRLLQFQHSQLESDTQIIETTDPSYSGVGVSGLAPMEFDEDFFNC